MRRIRVFLVSTEHPSLYYVLSHRSLFLSFLPPPERWSRLPLTLNRDRDNVVFSLNNLRTQKERRVGFVRLNTCLILKKDVNL